MEIVVYIETNDEGFVTGYSSSPIEGWIEITLKKDHPFFINHMGYRYTNGELVNDSALRIAHQMERKEAQLSAQCQERIEEGFVYSINNTPYKFSYDLIAQLNFQATLRLLEAGVEKSVLWTVKYPDTLEYTRIPLTLELIKDILIHAEQHRQIHVSKFRDFLLPIVLSSHTLEEILEVEW